MKGTGNVFMKITKTVFVFQNKICENNLVNSNQINLPLSTFIVNVNYRYQ